MLGADYEVRVAFSFIIISVIIRIHHHGPGGLKRYSMTPFEGYVRRELGVRRDVRTANSMVNSAAAIHRSSQLRRP
jgi:hypothetical protein